MKTICTVFLLLISSLVYTQVNYLEIGFNKNVELAGYLIHLGEPHNIDADHPVTELLNRFPEDKQNPALYKIFELASEMSYATVVHLAYSLPQLPLSADFNVDNFLAESPLSKTELETKRNLILYLDEFVRTSNFNALWKELSVFRRTTLETLNQNKPSGTLLVLMETFYEQDFENYNIVPSLTLWPTAGWGFKDSQDSRANFIMGPLTSDFDYCKQQDFINLAIHEFGHSFVNATVLKNQKLIDQTKELFLPLRESMTPQGYPSWTDCLVEHFVRAGEIIMAEFMGKEEQSAALLTNYREERNFIHLPFIIQKLKHYRLEENLSYQEVVEQTLTDLYRQRGYLEKNLDLGGS